MDRKGGCLGCLGTLLLGAGFTYFVWYLVAGRPAAPEKVADRFLSLTAEGRGEEALRGAAPALRARTTSAMLGLQARNLGLSSYAASSWAEVRVEENEATLEGTVTTQTGEAIPLIVRLVREDQQWLVLSLVAAPGEAATGEEDGDAHDRK